MLVRHNLIVRKKNTDIHMYYLRRWHFVDTFANEGARLIKLTCIQWLAEIFERS